MRVNRSGGRDGRIEPRWQARVLQFNDKLSGYCSGYGQLGAAE